jgi:protein-disulfide isomerase
MPIFKAGKRSAICYGILLVFLTLPGKHVQGQTPTATPAPRSQQPSNEQEEVRREIRELKEGQEALKNELQEIKRILLANDRVPPTRPAPPDKIDIGSRPVRGNNAARVVLIEFSDYQCPFCGRFFRDILPLVDKEYIRAGKIKYVFNNLPLEEIHSQAFVAAQAVECAGEQGRFWELHDRMFANQNALAPNDLAARAKAIELDMTKFNQCLESGRTATAIRANLAEAERMGIEGTPAFVIGLIDARNPSDTNLKILGSIGGAQPFPVFKAAIDKALTQVQ